MEITDQKTFDTYNSKRISYIIATKNRADSLRKSLTSCRGYKKPNDELIVIDGASTDNTQNVIKEFSDIIDTYISEPDINDKEAWNKGFLLSRGQYIKQIMDDDIFHKKGLEKVYNVMQDNPDVDLLVCGGVREMDGKTQNVYIPPGNSFGVSVDDYFQNKSKYSTSGCGIFFRRKLLNTVGLFEVDRPFPDLGFILRSIYLKKNVRFCRINMFYHVIEADSITRKNLNKYNTEFLELLKRYCSVNYKQNFFRQRKLSYQLVNRLYNILTRPFNKKSFDSPDLIQGNIKKPMWDGGFS